MKEYWLNINPHNRRYAWMCYRFQSAERADKGAKHIELMTGSKPVYRLHVKLKVLA